MKLFASILLLLNVSLVANAQNAKELIHAEKKQSGTTDMAIKYQKISNFSTLKSSITSKDFNLEANPRAVIQLQDKGIKLINDPDGSGRPIYVERQIDAKKSSGNIDPVQKLYSFFSETESIMQVLDPEQDIRIKEISTDDIGFTHIKTSQIHRGIEIYGTESSFHFNDRKEIFTGRLSKVDPALRLDPDISSDKIIQIAIEYLKAEGKWREIPPRARQFFDNIEPSGKLSIITSEHNNSQLVYEVIVQANIIEKWKLLIDAQEGRILKAFNTSPSDGPTTATATDLNGVSRTINTYQEGTGYLLVNTSEPMFNAATNEGVIMTYDFNNTFDDFSLGSSADNTWANQAAVSAHYFSKLAYKYHYETFGRNSINNNGGNIISFVNQSSEDGIGQDNAYWSGQYLFFGNGGEQLKNLAGGLDVVAHEMGHGVVSNTANLEYYGQSGAINETYADIFGAMVDRDDWLVGEDVVKTNYFPSGAMRDMSDPHNGGQTNDYAVWQPMHVSEMYIGEADNGGVHINSGIGNFAYYLFATAVTKEKAEQVFYRALVYYLTKNSKFIDLRMAVVQAAKDIYGDTSQEVTDAINAFDQVGISEEEQTDYAQDFAENPGPEYLLSSDTDTLNPNTLYKSTTAGTGFNALTSTIMKNNVSVSDDGSIAVFVSEDSKISAISTDETNIEEFILSNDEFWDNVSISKDGKRMACISIEVDTAIYVYDFVSKMWAKFRLYNPTTSHTGTDAGGVLYADAIEFDHTGEYILYDAYNEFNPLFGDPISYWDIGFIKVWDNQSNGFGNGEVTKLYGSLPEAVSIGNPTFSKNSPYIIAFDFWDEAADEFAILGANTLTGDVDLIVNNSTLGYPSYNKTDDKIAYAAFDTEDNEVVAEISLSGDKISPGGQAFLLINKATYPVYFAVGSRALQLEPLTNFTADVKSGAAPLTVQFIDLTINDPISWNWTFEGGTPASSTLQNPVVSYDADGIYQVSLTCANAAGSDALTKTEYITVSGTTSIQKNRMDEIMIYPNPASENLHINSEREFHLKIISLSGQVMKSSRNLNQIDISGLPSGIYIIHIEIEGKRLIKKLIKE